MHRVSLSTVNKPQSPEHSSLSRTHVECQCEDILVWEGRQPAAGHTSPTSQSPRSVSDAATALLALKGQIGVKTTAREGGL